MTTDDKRFSVCSCIRADCWHPKGMCDEPPTQAGGTCFTCRYYREPYKCPTCGQTVPEKKK